MTPREFRDIRLALGLSTEQLAERLGVDPRTIRRWQDGSQPVPGPVVAAMQLLRITPQALSTPVCCVTHRGTG